MVKIKGHCCVFLSKETQKTGHNKWFSIVSYTDILNDEPNTSIYKTGVTLGS